jgi:hypothetical protein
MGGGSMGRRCAAAQAKEQATLVESLARAGTHLSETVV